MKQQHNGYNQENINYSDPDQDKYAMNIENKTECV